MLSLASACSRAGGPAPVYFSSGIPLKTNIKRPVNQASHIPAPVNTPPVQQKYTPAQAPVSSESKKVTVRRGDTVFALARTHRVNPREIIIINKLRAPYELIAGQQIHIPTRRYHVVRSGDTLYSISQTYGVDMASLVRVNKLRAPYNIKTGHRLRLPSSTHRKRIPKVQVASLNPQYSLSKSGFAWPLQGTIVSSFGPKKGGIHNDGINIVGQRGTPILAAKGGVVVYAGKDVESYGNMILIQHPNNYVTAYAHTDQMHVKRGDKITRGQKIATVGSTGSVSRPQLHFEVRKGRRAVDPLGYLTSS